MFGLFSGNAKGIEALVARKRYAEAIELVKKEMAGAAGSRRQHLRKRLPELLLLDRRTAEAIAQFVALAEDYLESDHVANAIAIVRRLQRLDPIRAAELDARIGARMQAGFERTSSAGLRAAAVRAAAVTPEPPVAESTEDAIDIGWSGFSDFAEDIEPASGATGSALLDNQFLTAIGGNIQEMLAAFRTTMYEPGDIIVTEGERSDAVIIIASGTVKAFVRDADGHSMQVRQMHAGDLFGEIAVIEGTTRTATVIAASTCELLELPRAFVDGVIAASPDAAAVLRSLAATRYNSNEERAARAEESVTAMESDIVRDLRSELAKIVADVDFEPSDNEIAPKSFDDVLANLDERDAQAARYFYDNAISLSQAGNWWTAAVAWRGYVDFATQDVD